MSVRVFVAGFQHETNTFGPTKADWSYFTRGDMFPAFSRGDQMLARLSGRAMPMSGFLAAVKKAGWTPLPSCWAGGGASAEVLDEAYLRISGEICDDLRRALLKGVDAVYLDLHGAAVTETIEDPEGELLARVRSLVGPDVPVVASLDLHANVSEAMLAMANALVCYRTYPHIDMFETGTRAFEYLEALLAGKIGPSATLRIPFLIPLNRMNTMADPARSAYERLGELERELDCRLSFTMGFPAADIACCGPRVWGYGERAAEAVERLSGFIMKPRSKWQLDILEANDAVRHALDFARSEERPVVLADTQDNPGAGGDSNTTGMLRALVKEGAGRTFPGRVAIGLFYDPECAQAAHEAGIGATIDVRIGQSVQAFDGSQSEPPVEARCVVRALGDGVINLKGPMSMGGIVTLGPTALLDLDGCQVLVGSGKLQLLDREIYRHLGVEPEQMKILVNKSSVHFGADFAPIASHIIIARAKGPVAADPGHYAWSRLPPRIATRP